MKFVVLLLFALTTMEDLKTFSLTELIDQLIQQTSLYSKMHHEGANKDDRYSCREDIKALQSEIEMRMSEKKSF